MEKFELRNILYKNIPCWHEWSWQEKPPAIILRIHKEFIGNLNVNLQNSWIVKSLIDDFKFIEFGGDFDSDIGFNKVFKRLGEKDKFVEFLIKIPKVKKPTLEKCPHCDGFGKDKFAGQKCSFCGGTGKGYTIDWHSAYAVSASLTVFTALLHNCEKDTSSFLPQLLTMHTITKRDMHGGSLSGEISIPLCNWLMTLEDHQEIPEMIRAMKSAYDRMLVLQDFHRFSFSATAIKSGRFFTDCPGDACGLHPSDSYHEKGEGYKFSCHNVDSPMQQITLLAGLAALHDLARKGIKK